MLPVIWWLLRMTPPRPQTEIFPPLRILASVLKREETPHQSPWWLTLLRLVMATLIILALADPVLNPRERRIFEARRLAEDPITLEDLSGEFGVSRERVRQIEVRAFEKVSAAVRDEIARRETVGAARNGG